ncbi:hypothetical protein KGQ34_02705 [Patescibacteria group bacterium]|nr:hypothetical protein [Patescibacteria group bacterium]
MKICVERRLPKAPKPKKTGGPHGTPKGKKGYTRKQKHPKGRGEEEK